MFKDYVFIVLVPLSIFILSIAVWAGFIYRSGRPDFQYEAAQTMCVDYGKCEYLERYASDGISR